MSERRIEYMRLSELVDARVNPKRHDIGQIATSIEKHGYVEPVLLDERTGRLVSGHGRVHTVRELQRRGAGGSAPPDGVRAGADGEWLVPVVRGWASKSDADASALLLAANRLTALGGWDEGELTQVLKDLASADALEGSGFDGDDLDALLADMSAAASAVEDSTTREGITRGKPPVTCPQCGHEFEP